MLEKVDKTGIAKKGYNCMEVKVVPKLTVSALCSQTQKIIEWINDNFQNPFGRCRPGRTPYQNC